MEAFSTNKELVIGLRYLTGARSICGLGPLVFGSKLLSRAHSLEVFKWKLVLQFGKGGLESREKNLRALDYQSNYQLFRLIGTFLII